MGQEKKLIAEIKRIAKTGNEVGLEHHPEGLISFYKLLCCCLSNSGGTQMVLYHLELICHLLFSLHFQTSTKVLARQLIRLRQQIANLQGSRAQMRGIATHTQVLCQVYATSLLISVLHSAFYDAFEKPYDFCRQYLPNLQLLLA